MGLKFFSIPAMYAEQWEEEVNAFLARHRVISIDRQFALVDGGPVWCLAIEYLSRDRAATAGASASRRSRIDYREVLEPEQFARFSKLREMRKRIAEVEGTPIYAAFNNEQLAEIARRVPTTEQELQAIEGIGEGKAGRYGGQIFAALGAASPGDPERRPEAEDPGAALDGSSENPPADRPTRTRPAP